MIGFVRISQRDDRVYGFFRRDADGSLNGMVVFHCCNGKADQARAKSHAVCGEQDVLGSQERIFHGAACAGLRSDNDSGTRTMEQSVPAFLFPLS